MDDLSSKEDAEFYKAVDAALLGPLPLPNLSTIENGPNFLDKGPVIYTSKRFIFCWVLYTYERRLLTYVGEKDPGPVPGHLAKRQMGVPSTLNPSLWGSHIQEALNG